MNQSDKTSGQTFFMTYLDGTVIEYPIPAYVNYVDTTLSKKIIVKKRDYEVIVKAIPRQSETLYHIT